MTRGVADGVAMLNVLAQPDDRDWTARPYQTADYGQGLDRGVADLRIGFAATLNGAPVHPDVALAVARAAEGFTLLGSSVEAVPLEMPDVHRIFCDHWYVYAATLLAGIPEPLHERIDPGLRRIAALGAERSGVEHVKAGVARRALGQQMNVFHRTYDLLLTPTLPLPAFEAGRLAPPETEGWVDWTPFSYPFNLTMQPAATVPCGFTADGLPCGLQIVGRIGEDALVLRAARAFEAAHPWPMPDLERTVGA
jgi:aspartyl-tRNA(Asn)/glutamyl-tRNA(Gln) amidotransferase subunit A